MPCTGCRVKGDEAAPAPNCCENIVIGSGRTRLIRDAMLFGNHPDSSAKFILTHWHVSHYVDDDGDVAERGIPVYQCDAFDAATRRCTVHATRPDVCRRYPGYGDDYWERVEWKRYPLCGYVAEMLAEMAVGG